MRATCAVAVIRDGKHTACGLDCERVFGGFAEDGEGGLGVGWECPVHGCVGAQLREESGMSDQTHSEQSVVESRTVRIPTGELVSGWRRVIEVEVPWTCPVCGGPRGDVHPAIAYDGRYQMHVDGWENPCGHIDRYADLEKLEAIG